MNKTYIDKLDTDFNRFLSRVDLPTDQVDTLIRINKQAKCDLNSLLGLNDGNNHRLSLGFKDDEINEGCRYYEYTQDLINDFFIWFMQFDERSSYSWDFSNRTIQCPYQSSPKMSKFLAKYSSFFVEYVKYSPFFKVNRVLTELELITHSGFADFNKIGSIITRYFELSKSDCELIISSNPIDFIGINHNASYRSCYNIGSEYFSATISYLRDTFTLAAIVIDKKGRKIGRSWLYVFPDQKVIIQPRSYGSFNKSNRKSVREHIQNKLDCTDNWRRVSTEYGRFNNCASGGVSSLNSEYTSPVYFDSGLVTVSYNYTYNGKMEHDDFPVINFLPAICLTCGDDHNVCNSENCDECGERSICYLCEEGYHEDDLYYIESYGESVCEQCQNEYFFYCQDCNEWYHIDMGTCIDNHGFVCESCLESYCQCEECGEHIYNEDSRVSDSGECYCETCYNDKFTQCKECGTELQINDAIESESGNSYCVDCYNDKFDTCDECGTELERGEVCDCIEQSQLAAIA